MNVYTKSQYTITNILGGDEDSISHKDFLDLNYEGDPEFSIADRIQFDLNTSKFFGRVRLNIIPFDIDGSYANLSLKGYGFYSPVKYFGIAMGNSFFSKFGMKQCYFSALDDYPIYGKLLRSGIGLYSMIDFSDFSSVPLLIKLTGEIDTKSNFHFPNIGFNICYQLELKDYFLLGGVVNNIFDTEHPLVSVSVGQKFIDNLILNIGYTYNDTDTNFIPKKAKDTLFLNIGYDFEKINFKLYIDYISALNSYYISSKNNIKDHGYVPFLVALRTVYTTNNSSEIELNFKMKGYIGLEGQNLYVIYPSYTKIINKNNSVKIGARVTINENSKNIFGVIIPDLSIPVSWKFKYGN